MRYLPVQEFVKLNRNDNLKLKKYLEKGMADSNISLNSDCQGQINRTCVLRKSKRICNFSNDVLCFKAFCKLCRISKLQKLFHKVFLSFEKLKICTCNA